MRATSSIYASSLKFQRGSWPFQIIIWWSGPLTKFFPIHLKKKLYGKIFSQRSASQECVRKSWKQLWTSFLKQASSFDPSTVSSICVSSLSTARSGACDRKHLQERRCTRDREHLQERRCTRDREHVLKRKDALRRSMCAVQVDASARRLW